MQMSDQISPRESYMSKMRDRFLALQKSGIGALDEDDGNYEKLESKEENELVVPIVPDLPNETLIEEKTRERESKPAEPDDGEILNLDGETLNLDDSIMLEFLNETNIPNPPIQGSFEFEGSLLPEEVENDQADVKKLTVDGKLDEVSIVVSKVPEEVSYLSI